MTLPASEETVPATDDKFELHMASDESPLGLTLNKLRIVAFRNGTPENRQAYYDALSVAFQNGMLVSSDTAVIRATATREQAVRECAAACRQTAKEFLSSGYAAIQPSGSFLERFAADECEKAILSLIDRSAKT